MSARGSFCRAVLVLFLALSGARFADARVFRLDGRDVDLADVTDTVEVYVSGLRRDAASARWIFELRVRNTALAPLTRPCVVVFEELHNTAGPATPDGVDGTGKPFFILSASLPENGLVAGQYSQPRTLTIAVGNGAPRLTFRVFAEASTTEAAPLALVRTLDEEGLPLPMAQVTVAGPAGQGTATTDERSAVVTLGRGAGLNAFRFDAPGRLPVWRSSELIAGSVRELPSPRLVARDTNATVITPFGGALTNVQAGITVTVPAGAVAEDTAVHLTPLSAQTLPGLLPIGWSPLQAFWLETAPAGSGGSASARAVSSRRSSASRLSGNLPVRLALWDALKVGEAAALARWDTNTLRWETRRVLTGQGSSVVESMLDAEGAWAVAARDSGPDAPAAPIVGETLEAGITPDLDWLAVSATGAVAPDFTPASLDARLVMAEGQLVVSNRAGRLPSGTLLRAVVRESYALRGGETRTTPEYDAFISAYRRPAGGPESDARLRASFPLRPQLLFSAEELAMARVQVDVYPPTQFAGALFTPLGGSITNGGLVVSAAAGMMRDSQAVKLEMLAPDNFGSLLTDGLEWVTAFQLTVGELAPGGRLRVALQGVPTNGLFVLARVLADAGVHGLQPVERFASGSDGVLKSIEPTTAPRLSGVDGSGQYLLARVTEPLSLVHGILRDAQGTGARGFVAKHGPWTALSGAGGNYALLARPGTVVVEALDPRSRQTGRGTATIASGQTAAALDVQVSGEGPRVVAISPADLSTNVATVASIDATFTRPLLLTTVTPANVRLFDATNGPVEITISANLKGDAISILPTQPLAAGTAHALVLSNAITDLGGLALEGPLTFRFTTAHAAPSRSGPLTLTGYEPTNGVARVEGSAGMSEPGRPVVLVNETTGRTSTALAGVDGSFVGTIQADVDDDISVTLLNANGTVNRLPMTRQVFADGSVALFSQGGVISVPGEHGPIDFVIEPGSVSGKTKFKFESVPLAQVLTLVSNTQPEGGRVLGGVKVSALQGGTLSGSMDVAFPVRVEDMALPPGVHPTNCAFGLAIARVVDGEPVYELVDRMHYEDGRLVTHSPPFFGLLGPFEDILATPLLMIAGEVPLLVNGKVMVTEVDPATGQPLPGATREPLPGAIVSGRSATTAGGLRGRLRPGTVYAVSGADGSYTLMVSAEAGNPARPVAVSATHARFPGLRPESVVPSLTAGERLAIGNLLTKRDIVFPRTGGALDMPPTLTASHAPGLPEAGATVTVTFMAMDDSTPPLLNAEVQGVAAVGSTPASLSDVHFTEVSQEVQGATGRRATYTVRSLRPQVVQLKVQALDGNGNERLLAYPIVFGAPPPVPEDNPPPADEHDDAGPYVVGMIPPPGSGALAPGEPIILQFNEAIRREVLSAPDVVTLSEDAGRPTLELSADQTALSVTFPGLRAHATYTLTVGYAVQDLAGNTIDQAPDQTGNQTFVATFKTAATRVTPLDDVIGRDSGAGALLMGKYALVAERRGGDRGRVAVLDVSDPSAPQLVNEISLPAFPRDVALVPRYAYVYTNGLLNELKLEVFTDPTHPNRLVRTNDLLVAVGGLAGQGQLQWIRVIDVTDPLRPELVSGMVIGANGLALPGRIRWAAPTLAYLETSSPDRISVLNLQSLIIADLLSLNQSEYRRLPADGMAGVDRNGDGDYVDPGETLPLPAAFPVEFGGKEFALPVPDTDQAIVDFVLEKGGNFIGAILGAGRVLGPDGKPRDDQPVGASYRTLLDDGILPPRELASVKFASSRRPRRAEALFQHPLQGTNGLSLRDLVLVTLWGNPSQDATNNYLAVLDVTDRLDPEILSEIPIPKDSDEGGIYSVEMREDGLILVAQDRSTALIDPRHLAAPLRADGTHPALIGVIDGLGGSPRRFESLGSGLHITADAGSRARVVQTAPWLGFVGFPDVEPFDPGALATMPEAELEALMERLEGRDFLALARLQAGSPCDPVSVTNLDARTHHYVLARAPGGAGPTIELALESLTWAGQPLRKRGPLFPPVHAMGAGSLVDLGQVPGEGEAPARSLRAFRVSNRPTSPFYNLYVSRPFILVADAATPEQLAALREELDREILWSGDKVRVSLDPSQATNRVLGPFVGHVDLVERAHQPGVMAVADAFPADLIPSPNPGPVTGEMLLPLAMNALSAHSSELVINATDLVLAGRRMPFEFRRTYRGQSLHSGPFGRGWDFNYNQRVAPYTGGSDCFTLVARPQPEDAEIAGRGDLVFHTGGGQVVLFKDAGTNAPPEIAADPLIQKLGWIPKAARFYLPPAGLFSPMIRFKDGRYARLEPDGRQYWFNPAGRLDRIYDRFEKNVIKLVYNARGELTRIIDDRGQPIDIGYYRVFSDGAFRPGIDERATRASDVGLIARLKDYSGRDVLYRYTEDGLLERFLGPEIATGPAETFRGRAETVYRYSDASDLGRSAKSLIGVEGNDVGGAPILAVTDVGGRGRDTVGALSLMGQTIQLEQPHQNTAAELAANTRPVVVTSQDGNKAQLALDRLGRVTEAVLLGSGGTAVTNRQEYYESGPLKGLVRATVGPLGDRTEFIYDADNPSLRSRGNLIAIRKIPGSRGGPVLEATAQYDPFHNLVAGEKTDFNGVTTTITLAPDRRSVERITRGGERELFGVNEFGQPTSHTSMEGTVSRWDYNSDGLLSSRTVGSLQTLFSYAPITGGPSDPGLRGRPSMVMDPSGVPTTFVHDELDRVVAQERQGLSTVSAFDAAGNLVRRVSQATTNRAVVEEFDYLSHGFLREHRVKDVETGDGVADLVTTYTRDALNRVTGVVFPGGEVRRFAYDHLGRLEREEVPGSHTNIIRFDAAGNVAAIERGTAREVHEYDGHDRLIRTIAANGVVAEHLRDGNGNVTTNRVMEGGALLAETRYEFDELNRLRKKTILRDSGESTLTIDYNTGERSVTVTDALGAVARTFLDPEGRMARFEAPNHVLELDRDLNSNVTARRVTDAGGTFVSGYAFNARNQVIATTNSLGDLARFVPELDGRHLLDIDREGFASTNVFTLLGEVAARFKPNGVSESRTFGPTRNVTGFSDAADHLTLAVHDAQNRLVTNSLPNGATTVFSRFNAFGQPERIQFPRGVEAVAEYDAEGKLKRRTITGGGFPAREETYEYDGLRRLRRIVDPSGSLEVQYDLGGFVRRVDREYRFGSLPAARAPLTTTVKQDADAGFFRSELEYPDGLRLIYERDVSGRLTALKPSAGEPVIQTNLWIGDTRFASRVMGSGRIRLDLQFDDLPRLVGRRYTRLSDGAVLVDVRQAHDRNGAVLARQHLHRGGRTDLFAYDAGYRLTRADLGARPALAGETPTPVVPDFSAPAGLGGTWQSGPLARVMTYDATDVLRGARTLNPLGLAVAPLAAEFEAHDALLCAVKIDGFERETDAIGNVTRTRLAVRIPGQAAPELVAAELIYDSIGRLVRVIREDGVQVVNEYEANGLRMRRAVTGPVDRCVPSDIAFIYDGARLIEERDLARGGQALRRYFHSDDGDELVAADVRLDPAADFERVYFLTDNQRSVLALTDAAGQVTQRVDYDAWGQPRMESRDVAAPAVSWVRRETDGLLIAFSEPVLPPVTATGEGLVQVLPGFDGLELRIGGSVVPGRFVPEDGLPVSGFGSVARFIANAAMSGAGELRLRGGAVADLWGNTNAPATLTLDLNAAAGATLFTGAAPGSTAPTVESRSWRGVSVLFHGQIHDEDAGLLYCRARYYDPHTASFLQRDPAGYVDSVNPYAAFAHNPVSQRDPLGSSVWDDMRQMGETLQEDADRHRESGGPVNLLISMALEGFGGLLQMPAAVRDSWNVLQSPSQGGTLDLLNRMKAAEVVGRAPVAAVGVAASGVGAMQSLRTVSSFLASRARGMASTLTRKMRLATGRGAAVDHLMGQGLTRWEAEGFVNTMAVLRDKYRTDQVEAAVRSFGDKADLRRQNREMGMAVKPEWLKTKTAKETGQAHVALRHSDGTMIHRDFTGDLDFYYVKVNGRRLEESEFQQIKHIFNREMSKAYRKLGYTGDPGASVLHGAHLNLPELYGRRVEHLGAELGKKTLYDRKGGGETVFEVLPGRREFNYDLELINGIRGPGPEAFAVRIDGLGRVNAYQPDVGLLRRELDDVARAFRQSTGIDLGEYGWYRGFEDHFPTPQGQ